MRRLLVVVLFLRVLAGCGHIDSGEADAGDVGQGCAGCMLDGHCHPGTTPEACGAGGGACSVCPHVCQSTDDLGSQWCPNGALGWDRAPICRPGGRCDLAAAASCPAGCNSSCSTSTGCGL